MLEHIASVKDAMVDDRNQTGLDYDNEFFDQGNSKIVKYFPPKKLKEFIDSEENINYKSAFLLSSFTGLRESENLHILVKDIVYRGNLAEVIISDPNTGNTFSLEKNKQVPRTEILSSCLHFANSEAKLSQDSCEVMRSFFTSFLPFTSACRFIKSLLVFSISS